MFRLINGHLQEIHVLLNIKEEVTIRTTDPLCRMVYTQARLPYSMLIDVK
jgi:hypothetical protein